MAEFHNFESLDIRTGTIVEVTDFPEAKNPSYKILIDFGVLGKKKSSAQLTILYKKEDLLGKQIIAIVNFPPRQIATFQSEVLILGVYGKNQEVVLLQTEREMENGSKIG